MLSWRGLAVVPVLQDWGGGGGSGHLAEGEVEVPQSGQLEVTIGKGGEKYCDGGETVTVEPSGPRDTEESSLSFCPSLYQVKVQSELP